MVFSNLRVDELSKNEIIFLVFYKFFRSYMLGITLITLRLTLSSLVAKL